MDSDFNLLVIGPNFTLTVIKLGIESSIEKRHKQAHRRGQMRNQDHRAVRASDSCLAFVFHFVTPAFRTPPLSSHPMPYHTMQLIRGIAQHLNTHLHRHFISSPHNSRKLLNLHIFPHDCSLGFVLLVQRYLDHIPIHFPSADLAHKLVHIAAAHSKPRLQHTPLDLPDGLRNCQCDANADQFLEPGDVGC